MIIELTTLKQVQYHLQMGECVYFRLDDGFGFFKMVDDRDNLKDSDYKKIGEDGILGVVQSDDGTAVLMLPEDKNTYIDKVNFLLDLGKSLYVDKGLNFQVNKK